VRYLRDVASLEFFPERCTGCGACLEVCPRNVFELRGGKAAVFDKDSCMECSACAMNCPSGALSVDKGVGCAAALINSMIYGGEPSCDCGGGRADGCC